MQFEGFNPNAYPDNKQVSIGFGTKAKVKTITRNQALIEMRTHLNLEVFPAIPNHIKGNKKIALASFTFNTGRGSLKKVLKNKYPCKRMLKYIYVDGKKSKGLVIRRKKEYRLCLKTPPK